MYHCITALLAYSLLFGWPSEIIYYTLPLSPSPKSEGRQANLHIKGVSLIQAWTVPAHRLRILMLESCWPPEWCVCSVLTKNFDNSRIHPCRYSISPPSLDLATFHSADAHVRQTWDCTVLACEAESHSWLFIVHHIALHLV